MNECRSAIEVEQSLKRVQSRTLIYVAGSFVCCAATCVDFNKNMCMWSRPPCPLYVAGCPCLTPLKYFLPPCTRS